MITGNDKHAFYSIRHALLAESHLENGLIDRFTSDLPPHFVQFAVRDGNNAAGIFVMLDSERNPFISQFSTKAPKERSCAPKVSLFPFASL